jgi:hypothetical protein
LEYGKQEGFWNKLVKLGMEKGFAIFELMLTLI